MSLSDTQIAEIKKAFSICDQDGDGVIDSNELRNVMKAITESDPTEDEFQKILRTVDKDGDNKITWEEFLMAMSDWLGEEWKSQTSKRRKLTVEQERQELHYSIKGFFNQFKPASDYRQVRAKLQRYGSMTGSALINMENPAQIAAALLTPTNIDDPSSMASSSRNKLEFLGKYKQAIQSLPKAIDAILNPANILQQIEGVTHVARLLSIVEVFSTPRDRRAIADEIVPLFEAMVKHQLWSKFVKFIQYFDHPALQIQSLRALIYFAPGPRIASTPPESALHPSQMFFKRLLIAEGCIPILIKLLHSSNTEVVEQTALLLGTIASHNAQCRDYVIEAGTLLELIRLCERFFTSNQTTLFSTLVQTSQPLSVAALRNITWTMSVLAGATHLSSTLPQALQQWAKVRIALDCLGNLFLHCDDLDVLRNILVSLALLLPGVEPNMAICQRFMVLLSADVHNNPQFVPLVEVTIKTLVDLVRFNNSLTVALMQCGLLQHIKRILQTTAQAPLRVAACDLVEVLAYERGQIQSLIDSELVSVVITTLSTDPHLRPKLLKVIKYVTQGSPMHVRYLVNNCNAISVLARQLSDFKTYDNVLIEIWKYHEATYNFELVRDVLSSLSNIINMGEMESEERNGINPYALSFDFEALHKLGGLLEALYKSPKDNQILKSGKAGDLSIEARVCSLLQKVCIAFEKIQQKSSLHIKLSNTIQQILRDYESREQATQPTQPQETQPAQTQQEPQNTTKLQSSEQAQQPQQSTIPITTPNPPNPEPVIPQQQQPVPAVKPLDRILMKFFFEEDRRVIEVPPTLSYEDLKRAVYKKYSKHPGDTFKISYKDSEGDLVTIDSQATLAASFSEFMGVKETTMKIYLQKISSETQSSEIENERAKLVSSGGISKSKEESDSYDEEDDLGVRVANPHFAEIPNGNVPITPTNVTASPGKKRTRAGEQLQRVTQKTSQNIDAMTAPVIPNATQFSLHDDLEKIKFYQKQSLLEDLEKSTHFGREDLEKLHTWVKKNCEGGAVDKQAFATGLKAIGITDPLVIEQNFNAFDTDKDGKIDFREFACGLSVILKGTTEERIKMVFNLYDTDNDNYLSFDELLLLLQATNTSNPKLSSDQLNSLAKKIMSSAQSQPNQPSSTLSLASFVDAIKSQVLTVDFASFFPNLQEKQ